MVYHVIDKQLVSSNLAQGFFLCTVMHAVSCTAQDFESGLKNLIISNHDKFYETANSNNVVMRTVKSKVISKKR